MKIVLLEYFYNCGVLEEYTWYKTKDYKQKQKLKNKRLYYLREITNHIRTQICKFQEQSENISQYDRLKPQHVAALLLIMVWTVKQIKVL